MAGVFDLELNDGTGDQEIASDVDDEVIAGDAHVDVCCLLGFYTRC